ncbi:MAG: alkaline phosphatase, partial [bacterium]
KEIAQELLTSNFDFFGGGGLKGIKNTSEFLTKGGYKYIDTKKGFKSVSSKDQKVYVSCPIRDESEACRYSIDQTSDDITLSDITKKGIEVLDNSNGFFMMVEGGKIDWAAHVNDAGAVIKDVEAFDKAITEAVSFYNKHPKETLIIVTADHETGGFTLGYAEMKYNSAFKKLKNQKISLAVMDKKIDEYKKTHTADQAKLEDLLPFIKKNFGLGLKGLELNEWEIKSLENSLKIEMMNKDSKANYGKVSEPLSSTISIILDQKAGLAWTTFSHTGVPVMVFAKGQGSELFKSYIDNTDIPKNIMQIAGLK